MPTLKWEDGDKLGNRSFLQFTPGQTKRIALLEPEAVYQYAHYHKKIGTFVCNGKTEERRGVVYHIADGKCCELIGEKPRIMYCFPVVVYTSADNKGAVKGKTADVEFEFSMWTLSQQTFNMLKAAVSEHGPMDQDWLITAEKKNNMTVVSAIVPGKANDVTWQKNGLKKQVEELYEVWQYKDIETNMARALKDEQIAEFLGVSVGESAKGDIEDASK